MLFNVVELQGVGHTRSIYVAMQSHRQGDAGDNCYAVEQGIFDAIKDGRTMHTYSNKGTFGELALLYNTRRAATIKVRTVCTDAIYTRPPHASSNPLALCAPQSFHNPDTPPSHPGTNRRYPMGIGWCQFPHHLDVHCGGT